MESRLCSRRACRVSGRRKAVLADEGPTCVRSEAKPGSIGCWGTSPMGGRRPNNRACCNWSKRDKSGCPTCWKRLVIPWFVVTAVRE
eukprot:scaffold4360_cov199-Amphora_coffeaeformis.AAC.6